MDYDPDNPIELGAVIYISSDVITDRIDEPVGGAGIHGYYYYYGEEASPSNGKLNFAEGAYYDLTEVKNKPEDDEVDDKDLEDDEGEVVNKKKVKLAKPKGKVVKYHHDIDYCQTYLSQDMSVTKQSVALTVMDWVLFCHRRKYLKQLVIIEQGGLVTNLLTKFAPQYEANNWKLNDGGEIPYKDLIVKIYETYKALKAETNLKLTPIPDNVSEYGIDRAASNAKKAIYAGISGKPLNDFYNAHIDIVANGPSKPPKMDKHPFIQLKQVLFKKHNNNNIDNRFRYHFMSLPTVNAGIKKENSDGVVKQAKKDYFDYIGKTDTETIYQIADFKNPIKPIDEVANQLIAYDKTDYNKIFLGIISEIYGNTSYFDLIKYGGSVFDTKGSYSSRLVMKTAEGKIIGNEVSPPRRVKDAIFVLSEMSSILNKYYNGVDEDSDFVFTDITHYLYKLPEADSKKTKVTLVPDFTNNVKKINMQVGYKNKGKLTQIVYGFQIAYDIPPRNMFLHCASPNTKVSVVTWPEMGLGARYAIIVDTDDDTCIWSNWYSNIILTKGT